MNEQTKRIISQFLKLCEIPRPSHHTSAVSAYLYEWAQKHDLPAQQDALGEVIIDRPAASGYENAPITILQAHMDMVCVADQDVVYDALRDPIHVIQTEESLTADGTSLGADNGIGIAIALDMLTDVELRCGPIRAIFTVDEEDGMASTNMDAQYLQGDYLINLDWETQGSLCNSCAGGDFFRFCREAQWENARSDERGLRIAVSNLLGGHSGVEIHKGRSNAITVLVYALVELMQHVIAFRIADFSGGQAPNAIPQSAEVTVVVEDNQLPRAKEVLNNSLSRQMTTIRCAEREAHYTVADAMPERVLTKGMSSDLVRLLTVAPNGIHTMSPFVIGLVESSSNIGTIKTADTVEVVDFARSSSESASVWLEMKCKTVADLCGFALHCDVRTPGWAVNPRSRLASIACQAYLELTGEKMTIEPIHAGVECGAFAQKNPHLDMISIGPTIRDAHTPKETCDIDSVEETAALVERLLHKIAQEGRSE